MLLQTSSSIFPIWLYVYHRQFLQSVRFLSASQWALFGREFPDPTHRSARWLSLFSLKIRENIRTRVSLLIVKSKIDSKRFLQSIDLKISCCLFLLLLEIFCYSFVSFLSPSFFHRSMERNTIPTNNFRFLSVFIDCDLLYKIAWNPQ